MNGDSVYEALREAIAEVVYEAIRDSEKRMSGVKRENYVDPDYPERALSLEDADRILAVLFPVTKFMPAPLREKYLLEKLSRF